MEATTRQAVFLSYASQDAEAARRICEALRAAGVEVWFDQSELRGGDAWDAKIRKQIKECALFVPVISANTQARLEGYFRLEWRLADQRSHLMAKGKPFLLPVVIDETRDADAHVPDSFLEVQWTRLRQGHGGQAPNDANVATFSERVKDLLEPGPALQPVVGSSLAKQTSVRTTWPWIAAALAVIVTAAAIWRPWPAGRGSPSSAAATPRALSEAQALTRKAWEQINRPGRGPTELGIADDLCRRATTSNPDDAEAWAAWSQVRTWKVYYGIDASTEQREAAHAATARAMQLDAASFEARFAEACYMVRTARGAASAGRTSDEAAATEPALRALLKERAGEPRVCFALAILLRNLGRDAEAASYFDAMAADPAFAAEAWTEKAWLWWGRGRFAEALELNERALAREAFSSNRLQRIYLALTWTGDLDLAKATVESLPAMQLQDDKLGSFAARVYWWRREPQAMLRVLHAIPRPWITWWNFPKSFLTGEAHRLAGEDDAAKVSWLEALRQVEVQVAKEPESAALMLWKAELLARLGRKNEAETALSLARSLQGRRAGRPSVAFSLDGDWTVALALGDREAALTSLEQGYERTDDWLTTWAILRHSPQFDPLRDEPRFQALLARAEADPKRNPRARDRVGVAPAKSIAVLAFDNLSDDKVNEYFSDGISEELLNVLGKVPGLKVTARTSAFHFKRKGTPIPEIARQLGVAYVVEGSVQKVDSRVRIKAQLVNAADGFQMWSDSFNRELKDMFALQDEIAGLIARALSLKLGVASPAATATVNPEALRLYLEGRQAWNLRTEEGLARAQTAFARALALEPNFPRALAGLADVGVMHRSVPGGRLAPRDEIVAPAERAIALDATLAEPHATLGVLEHMDWNFEAADRHFQRAFALNPSYAWAHLWRGQSLMTQGRVEEAMAENQRTLEADPLAPRIASNTALFHLLAGRPAEAIASADRSLSLLPGEAQALMWKTEALLMLGRTEDALQLARAVLVADPTRRDFAYVLARAGNPPEAAAALAAPDPRFMIPTRALLAVGRTNEAMAGLEADARSSVFSFQFALFHPAFDAVRDDPRFAKMLETLRMTEVHARAQRWRAAHPLQQAANK